MLKPLAFLVNKFIKAFGFSKLKPLAFLVSKFIKAFGLLVPTIMPKLHHISPRLPQHLPQPITSLFIGKAFARIQISKVKLHGDIDARGISEREGRDAVEAHCSLDALHVDSGSNGEGALVRSEYRLVRRSVPMQKPTSPMSEMPLETR